MAGVSCVVVVVLPPVWFVGVLLLGGLVCACWLIVVFVILECWLNPWWTHASCFVVPDVGGLLEIVLRCIGVTVVCCDYCGICCGGDR